MADRIQIPKVKPSLYVRPVVMLAIFASHGLAVPNSPSPGATVFRAKCASCHGEDGQGDSDAYDEPLFGDQSVEALAKLIERNMPEDEPNDCTGDEAMRVAQYIYDSFYSHAARVKKGLVEPPRVELSRLTVSQYRNAIADVIGMFTPKRESEAVVQPGLSTSYFQSKGMSKADDLRKERVDYFIACDFGESSPVEGIEPDQFAIIWEGALAADDTGFYEFRVSTENGARLYLNNDQTGSRKRLRDDSSAAGQSALIDAWVSSGEMRDVSARTFLLGGRNYPLRLEFFKYKEKTSSVKLEWKAPHGVWSILDQRHLTTARLPRTFVVKTPFPADDRSLGYERGVSVSREWHAATTNAAIESVSEIMERLPLLANVSNEAENRSATLKDFVSRFASAAYRRPLSNGETGLLDKTFFRDSDADNATKRALLFVLTSPKFLYTDLTPDGEQPVQFTIASRLAFALWDSVPDKQLLVAATNGELDDLSGIEKQARRMLGDLRAKDKVRHFFRHWLEFDERDLAKDATLFPDFDRKVVTDLRYSLEKFIDEVIWSDASDYRQLLLADHLILNQRLRKLYVSGCCDAPCEEEAAKDAMREVFRRVPFPSDERSGVLTHPYLLSALAYHNSTSPIHRGVFLTRNIVGRSLKPPPIAVAFKDDEFAPDLTMREKITQLTSDKACLSCHSVINPLGFALENFDTIGRWRTTENQQPIDTNSKYVTELGTTVEFGNAREIATFAAESPSAHRSFVAQLFQHLVRQNPDAYGEEVIDGLCKEFSEDEFNVQNLIVRIAVKTVRHRQHSASKPNANGQQNP